MIEVLTNPDKFFEDRMKEEERLKIPALIVLIIGITSGIAAFLMGRITAELLRGTLPPEAEGFISIMPISMAIFALIFSLIVWVVFAVVFFAISLALKGKGTFKRTLEFVGYGYIPMIIGGVISVTLMYYVVYYVFPTMSIPPVTDPAKVGEALEPVMKSQMMLLSSALGILFTLWSANIWVFGLKHARNLTTKNAVVTVAIPVAAQVLFAIYQMGVI